MSEYGKLPKVIGTLNLSLPEVMYYLYLPIKLEGQLGPTIPVQLEPLKEMIDAVRKDLGHEVWRDNNIYITVKKMFCSPSVTANRPGWHCDGFGGDDLNYVWYDCLPTEFCFSDFHITEGDHTKSLQEFEEQAVLTQVVYYEPGCLLKLDSHVVHRVAVAEQQMMRTFVKISVSKDRYNLKDNSINHDLDYNWSTYDRETVRNNPATAQMDSYKIVNDDHFA